MGAPWGTEERSRAGRHRRTGEPLIRRRDHTAARPRRLPFPAPPLSALIGIAVLVLIGAGVIHLSGTGSAIPQESEATPAAATESAESDGTAAPTSEEATPAGEAVDGDSPDVSEGTAPAEQPTELVVHVSGAIVSPGVVRLPSGSRVDDALRAAGGASEEAELDAVNLARPVVDGEQIHVPVPGEEPPATSDPAPGAEQPGTGAEPAGGGGGGGGAAIDLNTASATELEELPGVGPAIAQRIIDHREQNGPFESVDQLEEVSGIGPATLEELRDSATV